MRSLRINWPSSHHLIIALIITCVIPPYIVFMFIRYDYFAQRQYSEAAEQHERYDWLANFIDFLPPSCNFPYIHHLDENIRSLVSHPKPLECPTTSEEAISVRIAGDILLVEPQPSHATCQFRYFWGALFPDMYKPIFGDWIPFESSFDLTNTEQQSDFIETQCRSEHNETLHRNIHVRYRNISTTLPSSNPMSMILIVLESTSRTMFRRHMPLTYALLQRLQSTTMYGYVKVGDNSLPNLMPVLSGKRVHNQSAEMLSDFAEEFNNKPVNVDDVRFIWDHYKESNCRTLYNDDVAHYSRGLFHYPVDDIHGFSTPPTTHYLRPFSVYVRRYPLNDSAENCFGRSPIHKLQADALRQFIHKYQSTCHFSFTFFTHLSHERPENLEKMDKDLYDLIINFKMSGALNKTGLIVMGDHGHRVSEIKYRYIGALEERMPFLSFTLPKFFADANPTSMKHLRQNAFKLTSNFDVHQTLLSLGGFPSTSTRGVSLLDEIPANRSCFDAGIPEHFCVCLQNDTEVVSDTVRSSAAEKLRTHINSVLSLFPNCLTVSTVIVNSIESLQVNQMILRKFREQTPENLALLNEPPIGGSIRYLKLQASLLPLNLTVETTLQHYPVVSDLLRINGPIYEVNPAARKTDTIPFCVRETL